MDDLIGRVAYSIAGRDKGKFVVIMSNDGVDCTVCDGKERPLERPKKKRLKHVRLTKTVLDNGSMAGNRALKKALSPFNSGDSDAI